VDTYGSTIGRDSNINTAVGNTDWTDYHLSTHFIADGGGNNWYNAIVTFRVQEHNIGSWGDGNYYDVFLTTPLWGSHEGASWAVNRHDVGSSFFLAGGAIDPSVVPINDRDNVLDIWAVGNQFWVSINGYSLTSNPIVDNNPNPHLYGGIGLGGIWESHTRYDYVTVGTMAPVPEPTTYLLLLAGLGIIILRTRHSFWN